MIDTNKPSVLQRVRDRLTKLWKQDFAPWWRDYQWVLLAAAWMAALYLGFVGFARYTGARGEPTSWLDLLYLTLQLVSLESGAVSPPIPFELQLARWLLPALTLYTAVRAVAGLFQEQIQLARLWSIADHVVICGGGRKGLLLAKGFRQDGQPVVVIEREEKNDLLEQFRARGVAVLLGDATDPALLRKAAAHRARALISVCGDDAVNAEVAVRVQDLLLDRPGDPLTCIIHIVEPQLCELLRERELGLDQSANVRLELFNIFDRGARLMLQEIPVLNSSQPNPDCSPHLLVVGLGKLGESLVLYAAQGWRDRPLAADQRLRITVIDREAEARCEALGVRYPKLEDVCQLSPLEMEVHSPSFHRAQFLYDGDGSCNVDAIYICLDNDSLGLHAGLILMHRLRQDNTPILVRLIEGGGVGKLLYSRDEGENMFGNLHSFELLERTCTPQLVLGGTHEVLARALHEEYLRQQEAQSETPETNPSMVPWEALPKAMKESNRRQVDHIGAKLRLASCGIAPLTDWDAASFRFAPGEVERLARFEHQRWCAELRDQGWSYAEGPKNPQSRTHPSLVPWEDLPESEREKDRNAVRKLPRLLARVGLQIYRRERDKPLIIVDEEPRAESE